MNDHKPSTVSRASVDLNADLGEGFPNDRLLLGRITSASVCCGAHAGDPATILATLDAARELGVTVGAHPGFPDREGFGRREQTVTETEVERLILDQANVLKDLATQSGIAIRFLKPHGALYNQAQRDPAVARGVLNAVRRLALPLLGQPRTVLAGLARASGVRYVTEGFPDRRYQPDDSLVPRSSADALIHDRVEMAAHVAWLLAGGVETLCIHGDDPQAVANADRVRQVLESLGIAVRGVFDRGGS